MPRLRDFAAATAACGVLLIAAAPANADIPSANASCLGQFAVFLAMTSDPNLGQGVVAPGATSAPGALAEAVVPLATEMPHTFHC